MSESPERGNPTPRAGAPAWPRLALASLVVLAAGSCVGTSGRKVSDEKISQLRAGMSKEEVRELLGSPQHQGLDANGNEAWTYTWAKVFTGIMGFGGDVETRMVHVYFQQGRLVRTADSQPTTQPTK